ncbi:unnamed protein product [Oppiella nova]|nr:unnamed protein product [Oppiella nova]CAG2176285.1 unnamed protein product [Oppiella nova]
MTEMGRHSPFCNIDGIVFDASLSATLRPNHLIFQWLLQVRVKCRWFDGYVCTVTSMPLDDVHRHEDSCPNRPGLRPPVDPLLAPMYRCRHCSSLSSYPYVGRLCGKCGLSSTPPTAMHFPIVLLVKYVMFGTFETTITALEVREDSIRMKRVAKNCPKTRFRSNIIIPFTGIHTLFYCTDPSLPVLFIQVTNELSAKFREHLSLGDQSPNGLKFDVTSNDSREQYIIIMLNDRIKQTLVLILKWITGDHCLPMEAPEGWLLLNRARSKSDSLRNSSQFYRSYYPCVTDL